MTDLLREFEQEILKRAAREVALEVAKKMLLMGDLVQKVASITDLTETEVEAIKKQLKNN